MRLRVFPLCFVLDFRLLGKVERGHPLFHDPLVPDVLVGGNRAVAGKAIREFPTYKMPHRGGEDDAE